MHPKTIARLAKHIRAELDLLPLDYTGKTVDQYNEAMHRVEDARGLLRYLVQHLANRHDAALLARFARAPGYINFR